MERLIIIWIGTIAVLITGIVSGCVSTRHQVTHFAFPFSFEGEDYEIISVVASDDRGHNYLTRRQNGRLVFSAKDEDQNGTIDTVLMGQLSVDAANRIYAFGIHTARLANKFRELHDARVFEYEISGDPYVINSLADNAGRFYNSFVYKAVDGSEVIGIDEEADGTLDRIMKGQADLAASGELYGIVLAEGIRNGRVVASDGQYLVEPRR